jgi:hypothetical protein
MPNYIRIPNLAHTASYQNSLTKIIIRLQKIIIIRYLEQVKLLKTNKKLHNISQILSSPKRLYLFHVILNAKQAHTQNANAIINFYLKKKIIIEAAYIFLFINITFMHLT